LWVAYAPCGSQHKDAVQVTLEQIDLIKRLIGQYPGHLAFVNDSTSKNMIFYLQKQFIKIIVKNEQRCHIFLCIIWRLLILFHSFN